MPRKRPDPFLLIAGPCVAETERLCLRMAKDLAKAAADVGFQYVFKASYDKANRTSGQSPRGPGIEAGLRILERVKRDACVPVLTDVHAVDEAAAAAQVADILQIPAFLCRQTDLILAAARTGRAVNVKKGQFLAPADATHIAAKLREGGCADFTITERGSSFGYNNLVVDMRGLAWMRAAGLRVVFDATHSVQRPGGLGHTTGGDRDMVPVLARAAAAAGIDGLFVECHPDPDSSPSDGANMLRLRDVPPLLRTLRAIIDATRHA